MPRDITSVTNGVDSKILYGGDAEGDGFHPVGFVEATAANAMEGNLWLHPIWLLFRPFQLTDPVGFDPADSWVVEGVEYCEVLGEGHNCIVLSKSTASGLRNEMWIDLEEDHYPVKVAQSLDGTPTFDLAISCRSDDAFGPVPTLWVLNLYSSNDSKGTVLMGRVTSTVSTSELNAALPDSLFELKFPPGTYVTDKRDKRRYIVKSDGSQRLITQAELRTNPSYLELLNSSTGALAGRSELSQHRTSLRWWLVAVNVVFVCVAFLWIGRRKWRAAR